jgi:large subunit ribosomal protein L10
MRIEKQAIVNEMRGQLNASPFLLLTDYKGMKVEQFTELRRQLRGVGAELHVVKNRYFRQVTSERGWKRLEENLEGFTAVVFGKNDVTETAKVLVKFKADVKVPSIKAGMLGATYLTAEAVAELAELPSKEVLQGMLVGTLAAPMSRLVGVMTQKLSSLVYVLRAIEEKKRA